MTADPMLDAPMRGLSGRSPKGLHKPLSKSEANDNNVMG